MRRVLVLTAMEGEARELARRLGLARVASTPFPHFATPSSRGRTTAPDPRPGPQAGTPTGPDPTILDLELMPVGLRAGLLETRWHAGGPLPDLVVSAGLCGALSSGLAVGDLLLPRVVLDVSGEPFPVDGPAHAEALAAARRAGYGARTDAVMTVTDIVATPDAKALLGRDTPAAGADLESAAILRVARDRGVPALVIRGVSDTAGQSLAPELTRLVDHAGRVRPASAVALALRRPWLIPNALALHRGTMQALEGVAAVLENLECPTR